MLRHEILKLTEQKYVGIKTSILLKDAEKVDFAQLHQAVRAAPIHGIDPDEHFMAMDADFTEHSFSYTPLVPVRSFEGNTGYTPFTRAQGLYCAFEVKAKDLNPAWFKRVFDYIEAHRLCVERTGYDLEYYDENYLAMIGSQDLPAERVLKILLKMQA